MPNVIKIISAVARFFVVWFIDAVSLLITSWLFPGISIQPQDGTPGIVIAVAAALLLGFEPVE